MKRFKLRIDGPSGKIETVVNDPGATRKGIALIAHPHPLHGGTMDNKVVQTVADTMVELGYVAVRPNFRGVGMSEGDYDQGRGEVDDMLAAAEFIQSRYPELPVVLVGFSFGAYVQSAAACQMHSNFVLLIAPAVNMFDFAEVPPGAVVIHGEADELVPLDMVRQWAGSHGLELAIMAGAGHFFHHKLPQLKRTLVELCRR